MGGNWVMRVHPQNGIGAQRALSPSTASPREDIVRRWLSMNQEVAHHLTLNLLIPRSWTSQPPELLKVNFYYYNPLSLWYSVI